MKRTSQRTAPPAARRFRQAILLAETLLFLTGVTAAAGQVREFPTPADSGSALPYLSADPEGKVLLSWVERAGPGRHALKYSVLDDTAWSAPRTAAEGEGWFVNWADVPSVVALPGGSLAAHWLERSGTGTYAYGVRVSQSRDGGSTWSPAVTPHRDSTQSEHGFVSMFNTKGDEAAGGASSLGAVWLDGREMKMNEADAKGHADGHGAGEEAGGPMTLRFASIDPAGALSEESLLDEKVCECCPTSAALTEDGPIVVYRDRLDGEVRDISVVRKLRGGWSRPVRVFDDGWKIDGCPVNGPAVDARGRDVAVAWFTAAGDTPRVKVAVSRDGGATFSPPVMVDDGSPLGRVDVVVLDGGEAAVSWLERTGGAGELRVKRIAPGGTPGPPVVIAPPGTTRSTGFPRMVQSGGRLVFAWTGDRVRTATFVIP